MRECGVSVWCGVVSECECKSELKALMYLRLYLSVLLCFSSNSLSPYSPSSLLDSSCCHSSFHPLPSILHPLHPLSFRSLSTLLHSPSLLSNHTQILKQASTQQLTRSLYIGKSDVDVLVTLLADMVHVSSIYRVRSCVPLTCMCVCVLCVCVCLYVCMV